MLSLTLSGKVLNHQLVTFKFRILESARKILIACTFLIVERKLLQDSLTLNSQRIYRGPNLSILYDSSNQNNFITLMVAFFLH